MLNMGGLEIVVILVVALLVLGPDKLPGLMRTIGKATKELRRASTEFQRTINTELTDEEESKPPAPARPEQIPAAGEPSPGPVQAETAAVVQARPESAPAAGAEVAAGDGKSRIHRSLPLVPKSRAAAKPLLRKRPAPRQAPDGSDTGAA